MKNIFIVILTLFGMSQNSCSKSSPVTLPKRADIVIGTHYYGNAEYTWPINYLNAIKNESIKPDLLKLKGLGFNTIILLASWSEFEPTIGRSNEDAYHKMNLIIETATDLELQVMIRIPYLWSLVGLEPRERIAFALLEKKGYRTLLQQFLNEFERKVVLNHSNIVLKFGSWEDFYILRDFFFSNEPIVSEVIRQSFTEDTGIDAALVEKNGKNFDKLMQWQDLQILELTKEIAEYGYEIRTDADLFIKDDKLQWHSHSEFYKNESNGSLIAYWAPYYGQLNTGEFITSEQAIRSLSWMLDSIALETSQLPFIDQLNFFDNSPGTEMNAKISDNEYQKFFDKLSVLIAERTLGYAFWTIKDYSHNLVINPAFSEGLKWWNTKNVIVKDNSVSIFQDGYLAQLVKKSNLRLLKINNPVLVVNVAGGNVEVEIESVGKFDLVGPGRHEIPISSVPQMDFQIIIKSKSSSDVSRVYWVGLFGHIQNGKIFDQSGVSSEFNKMVGNFNRQVAMLALQKCRGFKSWPANSQYFLKGVFSDGWTGTLIEFCVKENQPAKGFKIQYYNPISKSRSFKVNGKASSKSDINLIRGEGSINVCPPFDSSLDNFSISVSTPFIPANEDKSSTDLRKLGIILKSIERFDCRKKSGVW